jgi:5-formyltetrahydrofolate cyclo-ligase
MATPPATRRRWSAELERHLAALIAEREPRTIGFYWPFKAEFDPRPLVTRLLAEGHDVALPVVLAPKQPMEFRRWTPATPMESGVWDIPVPSTRDLVVPDLVLAPVAAFDEACYRLGYGGGYFDVTLAALKPEPFAIGIGFAFQRVETIHPQPHDIAMDAVVTEEGTRRRAAG